MCRIASLFFFRCGKEACQATRLQGKVPKEIHAIRTETLGEHAPLYATVKNWVAQVKCGDFSTCDVPSPGGSQTVTTPEIIDQIHKLILEDHRPDFDFTNNGATGYLTGAG